MDAEETNIAKCGQADQRAALELVLQPLAPDHRRPLVESLQRLIDEPLGSFDALVTAHRHDRLIAAAWAQPQPGATAALWLPQADGVRLDMLATPLIAEAMRLADRAGVELTQVLLEAEQADIMPDLLACGFRRLTSLDYLEWSPDLSPPAEGASESSDASDSGDPPALELTPAASLDRNELERLVAQTYVDTLDCPELDGLRTIAEVLDGYEQTGDHDPALWYVLTLDTQAVGVLLLTQHNSSQQMELIYMGVCPPARGQRVGQAAIARAQRIAADKQMSRLVLAVDARNTPAKRVYANAGFMTWTRRVVYYRPRPAE